MSFIRYVAVRPETIVSVVKTGKYPAELPDYLALQSDAFYVKESIIECVAGIARNPHQTFILALELPENNIPKFLNPEWIQHIFVYSQRGYNLLRNLFRGVFPKPIVISPDVYSQVPTPNTSHLDATTITTTQTTSSKKRKTDVSSGSSLPVIFSDSGNRANSQCNLELIRGIEHLTLLKDLINSAQEEILITTESIGFIPREVIASLRAARRQGVKICIYSNKEPVDWLQDFFEEEEIRFEQLNIHGKHLIIDRNCVVIGSFNWLSFPDNEVDPDDQSIKIFGNNAYVHKLRGHIYHTLINYSKIFWAKMNDEPYSNFKLDKPLLDLSLDNFSRMLLLTTFQQHEDYLKFICSDAQNSITIYSPFIIYPNAVSRLEMIAGKLKDGVLLHLFLNQYDLIDGTSEGYDKISAFIGRHPKLKGITTISPLQGSHRKTLIVDEVTYSEGSFNWFSSAQSTESDFHNQDTSLVVQGPIVRDLVQTNRPILRK